MVCTIKRRSIPFVRFAEVFNTDEVTIELESGDENRYILKCSDFNKYSDPTDVLTRGEDIIQMINGIGRLGNNNFNNLTIQSIVNVDKNGSKHTTVFT